jgi:hypothetical protein
MWGKTVVLRLEHSVKLLALFTLLTFFSASASAQVSGGAEEAAPTLAAEGGSVAEVPLPAPPPSSEAPPAFETKTPEVKAAEVSPPAANKPLFDSPLKAAALSASLVNPAQPQETPVPVSPCARVITADVVAFDQVYKIGRAHV